MATANFAARGQPKLDFCRSWNVTFEKCSFSKRSSLPLFKDSGIRVGFADHGTTDLWREVAGKRDGINYGRPANGWRPGLKNGLFIY
jgi:hypothetical protein